MAEIKNSLFRFATMRAPELLDEKERGRSFVKHRDPAGVGFFSAKIEAPEATLSAQVAALKTLAEGFTPLANIEAAKAAFGEDFYDFAVWLAKHRKEIYENKEGMLEQAAEIVVILDLEDVDVMWDNLFYQVITDASPAMRDLMLQMIVAHHFSVQLIDANKPFAAVARVIIPKAFYAIEEDKILPDTSTPPVTDDIPVTAELDKAANAVISQGKVAVYDAAIEELKKAQKKWEKENAAALKDAKAAYDETVAGLVAEAETTTDPETGTIYYADLDLPAFDFEPEAQVTEGLSEQLSAAAYKAVNDLGLLSSDTFAEVIDGLGTAKQKEAARVFDAVSSTDKVVAINNVLLPASRVNLGTLYAFVLKTFWHGDNIYSFNVTINVGYEHARAVSAICNYQAGATELSSTAFESTPIGSMVMVKLFTENVTIAPGVSTVRVYGKIKLDNGVRLVFDKTVSVPGSIDGIMAIDLLDGDGGTGGDEPADTTFIPSGFGLRRLGIADYRKVEQTVCCYVPGEVSHIENIMAREYKERSTRRLRRSEDTITSEKQVEKEDLTDSTSTQRSEMQQEVSNVLHEDTSIAANASATFGFGKMFRASVGGSFAHNTSKEQSNHQAVTHAQEVTQRAMERVVQKVREERVRKMVDEFEEQNKHGYDNRQGAVHVSGVYRWIDKVYKNQVLNYGKRLTYEFMVPQPSAFHEKALEIVGAGPASSILQKPVDPRTVSNIPLKDFTYIDETTYSYWAAKYNAEVDAPPMETISVGKSFKIDIVRGPHAEDEWLSRFMSTNGEIDIPEGYYCDKADLVGNLMFHPTGLEWAKLVIQVADKVAEFQYKYANNKNAPVWVGTDKAYHEVYNVYTNTTPEHVYLANRITGKLPITCNGYDVLTGTYTVTAICTRTEDAYNKWRIETFNAIIDAYEKKLGEYNNAVGEVRNAGVNPKFYREIENTVLRKNCIAYLVGHNNLGKNWVTQGNLTELTPVLNKDMDQYASLVKFIEQAFEWDIISYAFYPFYWAGKDKWQNLYQQEVEDPLFRSFLQSGMARVVVTVTPGFEEAVMNYMVTGKVWNGGQVPVIGDDLYLSIVEELKNPEYVVDDSWETRVPTTLTVIQSGSIGLNATGLPCDCGDTTGIVQVNATLGVSGQVNEPITLAAGATQWSVPAGTLIEKLMIIEPTPITFSAGTTPAGEEWIAATALTEGGVVDADRYFADNTLVYFNGVTTDTVIKIYKR